MNEFDKLFKKIITEWTDDYDMSDDEIRDYDYENVTFSCSVINLCKIDFIPNQDSSTYDIQFAVLDTEDLTHEPEIEYSYAQNKVITNLNDGTYNNTKSTNIGTITAKQYQQLKDKYDLTDLNNFVFFVTDWIDGGEATFKGESKLDEFNQKDYSDWETNGHFDATEEPARNDIVDDEYGLINNTNFDNYSNLLQDILELCNIPSEDKLPGLQFIDGELVDDAIQNAWESGN